MADNLTISLKVKDYISNSTFADKSKIKDETLVFKEGFLDSMGFVSLITYLEKEFGIITRDKDLIEENFESVSAITNYVSLKLTT